MVSEFTSDWLIIEDFKVNIRDEVHGYCMKGLQADLHENKVARFPIVYFDFCNF